MRHFLAVVVLVALAFAGEEIPGASVVLHVVDAEGKPLAGVRVRAPAGDAGTLTSDVRGVVRVDLPVPPAAAPPAFGWEIDYELELDAYSRGWARVRPFRGARIERTVLLRRNRTMRIAVLGPGDEPVRNAKAHLSWTSPDHGGREEAEAAVDGSGVLAFGYAEGIDRVDVRVGGWSGRLRPAASAAIRLAPRELPPKEAVALPEPPTGPALVGVLSRHDGSPARGWFVTADVTHTGGCGTNWSWTTLYSARDVRQVDEDGRFSTSPSGDLLAVFSPEGLPVLYGLNPPSWEQRPRRIALRLPPAAAPLVGVVSDPHGKLLPGVAIVPRQHRGASWRSWWWVVADAAFPFARSDEGGAFAVPRLRGQDLLFGYEKEGYGDWDTDDEEARVVLVPKPTTEQLARKGSAARHLVVDVRDPQDNRIERLSMYAWCPHRDGRDTGMPGHEYHEDSRGLHLFLGAEHHEANGVTFKLESPGWEPYLVNIALGSGLTQETKLVWPEEMRRRPLRGRLLGTEGEPVRGSVVAVRGADGWTGLECMTDDEGRFAFPHAPRPCRLDFDGATVDHRRTLLPGWVVDREIGADEEEIVVRLERAGSVKLVVAAEDAQAAECVYLAATDRMEPSFDATDEPGVLRVPHVRPGEYRFGPDAAVADLGLEGRTVRVEAGKEAVVDVSRLPRVSRPQRVWHEVICTEKAQPVSGADVWVFTDAEPGAVAPVVRDLTDDGGRVRFQLEAGRRFHVVARCVGRLTGLATPRPDERTTALVLRPVRTLRARTPPGSGPATLRLLGREEGLGHAMAQVLGLAMLARGPSGFGEWRGVGGPDGPAWAGSGELISITPRESVAYDMPVGLRFEVAVAGRQLAVTVEPGDGDQVVDFGQE